MTPLPGARPEFEDGDAAPRPQPTLETPRLRLRPLALTDAPAVEALASARAVADTTLTIPHPYPPGVAEAWISGQEPAWAAGKRVTYAVTRAADGVLVGVVTLVLEPRHASAELAYWVGEPYWGQGYATEAAAALCAFGFARLGLHRIEARHFTRNPASGRVMEKLGMRREGLARDAVRKGDRFEDLILYAVLAPEWAARPPAPPPRIG